MLELLTCRVLAAISERKVIGHGHRRMDHPDSSNPAGSDPPNPVPETVGSSLDLGCYESNHEPIRRSVARILNSCHTLGKSGRLYRTPVNVFRAPEGFLIALTMDGRVNGSRMC
jgi:hypothetical protein